MPFLRAGFNPRNHDTGIRAMTSGGRRFKPAELREFASGDLFWYGDGFLAWGLNVVAFRSYVRLQGTWQGLPCCHLDTRAEDKTWTVVPA